MPSKKSKAILRIEILDNHPDHVLLADYLKSTGDAKGQVLAAVTACFYPIAIAQKPNVSRQEKEMALSEAIRELDRQKSYLIDRYRIFEQIEQPSRPSSCVSFPSLPQGADRASDRSAAFAPTFSTSSEDDEDADGNDDSSYSIGDPTLPVQLNF
jgi:hypothetical protein